MPGLMTADNSGSIVVLGLNREGLESAFETRKQKGYVAAYQVVKARGKQQARLHMATVEEGTWGGETISTIYTYFWKSGR